MTCKLDTDCDATLYKGGCCAYAKLTLDEKATPGIEDLTKLATWVAITGL